MSKYIGSGCGCQAGAGLGAAIDPKVAISVPWVTPGSLLAAAVGVFAGGHFGAKTGHPLLGQFIGMIGIGAAGYYGVKYVKEHAVVKGDAVDFFATSLFPGKSPEQG